MQRKIKKVIKGLNKASKTHAGQAKNLKVLEGGYIPMKIQKILLALNTLLQQTLGLLLQKLKELKNLMLAKFKSLRSSNKEQNLQGNQSKPPLRKRGRPPLGTKGKK